MELDAPNSPFRWETASGLEHSCYTCPMKMSNPKARQTCYGIHATPCHRYHQTMHAIGMSHKCAACIVQDELHDGRHRKIAELLAEYQLEGGVDPTAVRIRPDQEEAAAAAPAWWDPAWDALDLAEEEDNDNVDQAPGPQQGGRDDDAAGADTSTTASDHQTPHKQSKAEVRAQKKAAKAAKSQMKAAKNEKKVAVSVRREDVEWVDTTMHGAATEGNDAHPLATDRTIEEVIERNRRFIRSMEDHKKQLLSSIVQRRKADRERRKSANPSNKRGRYSSRSTEDDEDDENDYIIAAILAKLGIDQAHIKVGGSAVGDGGKKGGATGPPTAGQETIIEELKGVVKEDLAVHENEQRQRCIRAGGFWRYVGKPVFDRMTELAREYDWRTGLRRRDE